MNPTSFPTSFTEPLCYPWTYSQIACPCCGHSVLDIRLYYSLRALWCTTHHGYRITSLARCAKHNHEVGGVPGSLHIFGRAVDIAPTKGDLHALAATALTIKTFRNGGFGFYPMLGILHLDVRPKPSRWSKDAIQIRPCPDLWHGFDPLTEAETCPPLERDPLFAPALLAQELPSPCGPGPLSPHNHQTL